MKNQKVLVYFNPDKKKSILVIKKIEKILKHKRIKYEFLPSDSDAPVDGTIAIALGGDGTILKVAQKIINKKIPLFGINLGTLGFLAEADYQKIDKSISAVLSGKADIQQRMLLKVKIVYSVDSLGSPGEYLALNDCVIKSAVEARVISISAFVNKHFLTTYVGDGVIVSTPTGSTAYSLAAQGPIVYPDMDLFILNPICPHTLTQRPLIINDRSEIELVVSPSDKVRPIRLSLDGQNDFGLHYGDRIIIGKSPKKLLLATLPGQDYFSILREKLNWGER